MVLYAASNIMAVNIPADAIGGGVLHSHSRPVRDGAQVHPWGLECPPCEDYLRTHNSDQWSATITEIPETYDETKAREQAEKSGKLDRERQLADTMIELRQLGQLPEVLGHVLDRILGTPAALSGVLECANGHGNPAGQKFCGDCGAPMSAPVTKAALPGPERPAEPPAAEPSESFRARPPRLRDARLDQLQALARARGISEDGTRPDLIGRLKAAGATGADLLRLPVAA